MSNRTTIASELIPDELVAALNDDANRRRIDSGTARIANCRPIFEQFDPSAKNSSVFLAVAARWCDITDAGPEPIRKMLATYDEAARSRFSVADYVRIRMAEGMVALKEDHLDKAIEDFEIALKLADQASAADVLALSNYWTGRCLRRKGKYEDALKYVRKGREIQFSRGHVQCSAAMRVLEGLILVENDEPKAAIEQLRAAEAVLIETDDYITLGNIQSTYGRTLQREGHYRQAIEHYSRAIEHFQKRDTKGAHIARAEVDASFTRIQVARHLRRNIDVYAVDRQKNTNRPSARAVQVKELAKLSEAVLANLDRAASIYERCKDVRGLARVHLYRGLLRHVVGELEMAMQEATKAYASAESKQDIILMASARNLQCMVEEARVEEEIEGWADHALAAQDYAREAVELASRTQDSRLLARVHIWYGLILSNAFFHARERAREEMELAAGYLEPNVRNYIWEDFQILKRRLLENNTLDTKLIQWARGDIREKTFRELEEDFADLVIPIAWRQEDCKVSRVAARFSISPRKVRRVLARLGYLDADLAGDTDADADVPAEPHKRRTERREAAHPVLHDPEHPSVLPGASGSPAKRYTN